MQGGRGKIIPKFGEFGLDPDSPNKTFCLAPFTHTYISPQGERRMCCASREPARFQKQYLDSSGPEGKVTFCPQSLEEHWNSGHMKSVRRRLMAGEKIPECQVCNEDVLSLSVYRNWFHKLFHDRIHDAFKYTDDEGCTELPVISFDYRISNLCNFKCRMCGDQLSSSWEAENRKYGRWNPETDPWYLPENQSKIREFRKQVTERELWRAAEQRQLCEIYWVGGEPLYWDIHWQVMDRLVQNKHSRNVYARYNTNLSMIEHKGLRLFEDILPFFDDYMMCCSIDGTGKIVEFIRSGVNWGNWLDNFKQGCFLNKEKMFLDLTLTLPGLFSLKELFDLSLSLDVGILTKITYAFDPFVLMSPMSLPRDLLNEIIEGHLSYMRPRAGSKQQSLVDTLEDMKTRPNFAETWPEKFREGFEQGKKEQQRLAEIRGDGKNGRLTLKDILARHPDVLKWWEDGC